MAKIKKLPKLRDKDRQKLIDSMTPQELEDMKAFEEEFVKLDEETQNLMLAFAQTLDEMSEEERIQVFEAMDKFEKYVNGDDALDEDFDEDGFDDDNFDDDAYDNDYAHFLPSKSVQKYTLRVTLKGIEPKIYRKFNVPSNITLRHLSELIIELMGWTGEHLNQFRKGDDYFAPAYQRKGDNNFMLGWGRVRDHNQEDFTLSDILHVKGKTIEWEYDFGDSWCHEVRLSSISDFKDDEPLVSFVKGERECPPEDCGGIWGYMDLLDIYDKKKERKRLTSDEKERLEWYEMDPKDFNPDLFDTDMAQIICEDYCE